MSLYAMLNSTYLTLRKKRKGWSIPRIYIIFFRDYVTLNNIFFLVFNCTSKRFIA